MVSHYGQRPIPPAPRHDVDALQYGALPAQPVAGGAVAAPPFVAPSFEWVAPHVRTAGDEVADLAEAAGLVLDAEQRHILRAMYAEDARGNKAALEFAVICARQNLKTFIFEVAALGDLFLVGRPGQLIIWTAHLFPTANEAFLDIKRIIDGNEFLSRRVRKVTEASGSQGVELHDGSRLKFLARSKTGGRGMTGDTVFLDEAFALSATEIGALFPTLSAVPDPQLRYGSSAGLETSAVLRSIRDRGRRGGDPRLTYLEWADPREREGCAEAGCDHHYGIAGCALDDRARIQLANPAAPRRIPWTFIEAERRALPPAEFARERLGWWDIPKDQRTDDVAMPNWAAQERPDAAPLGAVALGLDVAPDSASAAILACADGTDGVPVVEVVAHQDGTAWVPGFIADLVTRHEVTGLGLISGSPAHALLPDLPKKLPNGGTIRVLTGSDVIAACAGFAKDVNEGALVHCGEPDLDAAAAGAVRRFAADGWRWSRRDSSTDISPLYAAAIARHLHRTAPTPSVYDPLDSIY